MCFARRLANMPTVRGWFRYLTPRCSCSFAIVIQQLPEELRDAVCVFYLVLRALDTVEDDMAVPDATKLPILKSFYKHIYQRYGIVNCMDASY